MNEFDQPPPEDSDVGDEGEMPLPPNMSAKGDKAAKPDADSSDDEKDDDEDTPKTRKSKSRKSRSKPTTVPVPKKEGIKTLPLVMLVMLTGTTLIPALLFMGDKFGAIIQRNHIMGNIGHRLGIGPSPKKRVLSFYEKHDPAKIDEVQTILAKYYGDYPKLTKRLERKYADYGYFINWEQDEAPMTLAFDQLHVTIEKVQEKWNRYAPELAKTGVRNIKYNVTFLYKRVRKVCMKKVWPMLQPYLGVPDAKAARAQKREDASAAQSAKPGRRKKNTEFRDDVED